MLQKSPITKGKWSHMRCCNIR